jgi:hypothetical protein
MIAANTMPHVIANPLDHFGGLRPKVNQVAKAPDFISWFPVNNGPKSFVVAVNIGHKMRGFARVAILRGAPIASVAGFVGVLFHYLSQPLSLSRHGWERLRRWVP